jgi:hypothetical protein
MEVVLDRIPEQQVGALLAKLQAPPLNEIADMPNAPETSLPFASVTTPWT